MSNLQSDERLRQMSKQEEILLKRKKEIERKLKSQKPKEEFHNSKQLEEDARLSRSNMFNNDGSFLEQFKKLSNSNTGKKESSSVNENKGFAESLFSSSHENFPSRKAPPFENEYEPETKQDIKSENVADPCQSDWFQEALKRARVKAKEITSIPSTAVSLSDEAMDNNEARKRKSRWAEEKSLVTLPNTSAANLPAGVSQQTNFNMPMSVMDMVGEGQHMEAIQGIMISNLTRSNPAIISYALKVFGSMDLTDAQWKQCEEQMKMNIVFQLLQEKNKEAQRLQQEGKVKYEYDSDEDIDGGTWEHKRRKLEMCETAIRAEELTRGAEGKHHIGDFLPPEELAGFMEKYTALKEGRDPDLSDYREKRLTEDNVGYRMLKSMGWTEGTGLGTLGRGITNPVNQNVKTETQGLGAGTVNNLSAQDDEYDAYRKRMMLAYRFRPNPLNNPRRAYY